MALAKTGRATGARVDGFCTRVYVIPIHLYGIYAHTCYDTHNPYLYGTLLFAEEPANSLVMSTAPCSGCECDATCLA